MDEIHDFYGPYQIHVAHDGSEIVFIKNQGAFSPDSERLKRIVDQKMSELLVEYTKWKTLSERIGNV
jgi:hypothetical protein